MHHGSSQRPVVSLRGLSRYFMRDQEVAEMKRSAQRAHRRRVKQQLKTVDPEEFDGQVTAQEALTTWKVV